jgi:hypothetical protein
MHLATRIPRREEQGDPEAWRMHDRLRTEATAILVDAAIDAGVARFVFPSIAFVYPPTGQADESTPVASPAPEFARSAFEAEREVTRFADAGRDGVILRLGLLYRTGTGSELPAARFAPYGATVRIEDAGGALAGARRRTRTNRRHRHACRRGRLLHDPARLSDASNRRARVLPSQRVPTRRGRPPPLPESKIAVGWRALWGFDSLHEWRWGCGSVGG